MVCYAAKLTDTGRQRKCFGQRKQNGQKKNPKNPRNKENLSLENSQNFSLAGCGTQSRKRQEMETVR